MKNPFARKQDKTVLIGAIAAGAVLAGTLTWLLLTDDGNEKRERWQDWLEEKGKDIAANFLSAKTGVEKAISKKVAEVVAD